MKNIVYSKLISDSIQLTMYVCIPIVHNKLNGNIIWLSEFSGPRAWDATLYPLVGWHSDSQIKGGQKRHKSTYQ